MTRLLNIMDSPSAIVRRMERILSPISKSSKYQSSEFQTGIAAWSLGSPVKARA
jgi:hypothetical protein